MGDAKSYWLYLVICALIVLPLFANNAAACTCNEYGTPPCAAFWRAEIVFVGRVIEIGQRIDNQRGDDGAIVRLSVEKVYRGSIGAEVFDRQSNGADCRVEYENGKQYLLYAYDYQPSTGKIITGGCDRSRKLARAQEDLEYIRSLAGGTTKQSVMGQLLKHEKFQPLKAIKVAVEGSGKLYETITDKKGHYEILLPHPGSYQVRLFIPFGAGTIADYLDIEQIPNEGLTIISYKLKLAAGQCDYKDLKIFKENLRGAAKVSGKIIDANGLPASQVSVELCRVTADRKCSLDKYQWVITDAEGKYDFIGMANGIYWMGINILRMPDIDSPYPTTFYPGVQNSRNAIAITVNKGQTLSLPVLSLPAKLVELKIYGSLHWPDGTPVSRYSVLSILKTPPALYILDPQQLLPLSNSRQADETSTVKIDDQGRFSIVGFEGYTYILHVHAFNQDDKPMHAKHVKVTSGQDLGPIKLVLSLPGDGKNRDEIKKELDQQP